MIDIRMYVQQDGRSPFERWFQKLSSEAARRVATSLYRLRLGNFSNVKGVGSGVFEYRIDFGPGYRVYFGKDGEQIVILLCGGSKLRQQDDIDLAKGLWTAYKKEKGSTPWH